MEYNIMSSGQSKSVKLRGQFTFTDANKFKEIIELPDHGGLNSISLDFSDITFVDSACMGMLLLLRDKCQASNISLNIHSPQGQVEKVFNISRFDQLFSISKSN